MHEFRTRRKSSSLWAIHFIVAAKGPSLTHKLLFVLHEIKGTSQLCLAGSLIVGYSKKPEVEWQILSSENYWNKKRATGNKHRILQSKARRKGINSGPSEGLWNVLIKANERKRERKE
jgi:hypothetical protein